MKTTTIFKGRYPYKEIQIPKDEALEYLNKGKLFAIEGKNEEAIEAYEKALEIEPNYKQALINLRVVYWQMGRFEDIK
jgi:tetratricopeptide (TPR) repeat protein